MRFAVLLSFSPCARICQAVHLTRTPFPGKIDIASFSDACRLLLTKPSETSLSMRTPSPRFRVERRAPRDSSSPEVSLVLLNSIVGFLAEAIPYMKRFSRPAALQILRARLRVPAVSRALSLPHPHPPDRVLNSRCPFSGFFPPDKVYPPASSLPSRPASAV